MTRADAYAAAERAVSDGVPLVDVLDALDALQGKLDEGKEEPWDTATA